METKFVPVTSLRPQLLKCISRAGKLGEEYVITKNGRPTAVIIGFDEWESWKETIELLSDSKALKRIKKNKAYFNRGGKGKSIMEVFGS